MLSYQIKKYIVFICHFIVNSICFCLRIFPIKSNRVFVMSYHGKNLSGNPKYVAQYIKEHHPEMEVIVGHYDKLEGYQTVKPDPYRINYLYYLMTSKFWVDNCRKTFPIYKRSKQVYIQTWHGTALKRIEFDAEQSLSELYLHGAKIDSQQINYFVSPNRFMSKMTPSTFKYDGELLEVGYPRNDILINLSDQQKQAIKKSLNLDLNKKIILYGPTYRDGSKNKNDFSTGLDIDLDAFYEQFGEEYQLLLRLHSNVATDIEINPKYEHLIHNVSFYPDSQELLAIADLLITDYSSLFFDFAVTKRPMIFYAHDLELYRDKLRGFYFEYESFVPGPIARNMEQLFNILKNWDDYYTEAYYEQLDNFCEEFTTFETGHAAEQIAKLMTEMQKKK